jgi:hypothetical protein
MDIRLVTHVEEELVRWAIEDVVQRDGEFYDPEIWAKMPTVIRKHGDQPFANFRGQLVELRERQLPYVLRRVDTFE